MPGQPRRPLPPARVPGRPARGRGARSRSDPPAGRLDLHSARRPGGGRLKCTTKRIACAVWSCSVSDARPCMSPGPVCPAVGRVQRPAQHVLGMDLAAATLGEWHASRHCSTSWTTRAVSRPGRMTHSWFSGAGIRGARARAWPSWPSCAGSLPGTSSFPCGGLEMPRVSFAVRALAPELHAASPLRQTYPQLPRKATPTPCASQACPQGYGRGLG